MAETKFIQTEVGRIPQDWECLKFGIPLHFLPNNSIPREFLCDKGEIKNIHYGDILIKYGCTLDATNTFIPSINSLMIPSSRPKYFVNDGDVIIADTAEDEMVGKATELWNVGNSKIVSGLHTLWCRPLKGFFSSKYLGYFINSHLYHSQILPLIQGIKVSSISKKDIQETWLLVPPLAEQERIASALTAADNFIASLDKQIAKTRNLKQATMQRLLSSLPNHSPLKPLGEVYRRLHGTPITAGTMQKIANPAGDIIIYAGGKTIVKAFEKDIPEANITKVPAVLIQSRGVVDALYCDKPFTFKNEMWAYTCDNTDSLKFLCYYLRHNIEYFRTAAARSGMPQISLEDTETYLIPVPPIEEQERIASILTAMDRQIAALEAKRSKYEMVKQGMMQQLLTGTIRLI